MDGDKPKNFNKGYIGRSMSVNAKKARDNGMITRSEVTSEWLKSLGFNYSVAYFQWLCKYNYIRAKEIHHTSAAFKSTKYFDENTVLYVVKRYNLDLLYRIYLKKINKEDAKKERGIRYVKIKTTDRILGLRGKNIIIINCVKCDGFLWYARGKYIHQYSKEYVVLDKFERRQENDFINPNMKRIVNLLLKYKPKYAIYLLQK